MAIRDIVTRGFGNGTYDPGVSDVVTRGYTIGAALVSIVGGCVPKAEVYLPGIQKAEVYLPGSQQAQKVC